MISGQLILTVRPLVTQTELDLSKFAAQMRCHHWDVSVARDSLAVPLPVLARWSAVPPSYATLVCGLSACVAPTEQTWMVVGDSFETRPPGFRWNEFEMMSMESAEGDAEWSARITEFWNGHIPVVMDVSSAYDIWLLRLCDGAIIHTYAPEWEEGSTVVADALVPFLVELAQTGEPPWESV